MERVSIPKFINFTENVWDFPRPAICQPFEGKVKIFVNNNLLASSAKAWRVLETSHPPTFYFPPEDIKINLLKKNSKKTLCEWKGIASYYDYSQKKEKIDCLGWSYDNPSSKFLPIKKYISFYSLVNTKCFVNNEIVIPQEGDFYGGWITKNLIGPFKGGRGTLQW